MLKLYKKVFLSLIFTGVSCAPILLSSCTTNGEEWKYYFTEEELYDPAWGEADAPYQHAMPAADYTQAPYTDSVVDPLMCADIEQKINENNIVSGLVRTERMVLNKEEGYLMQDMGINISFDANHNLHLHWRVHADLVDFHNQYLMLVHHQIFDFWSVKASSICFAANIPNTEHPDWQKPLLSFGTRDPQGETYWHYDLWDSVSSSNEIHTGCIQMFLYCYPSDWDNVVLPDQTY